MNEIVIGWYPSVADLIAWARALQNMLPAMLFWRLFAIVIGVGIVAHFWLMANYGHKKAPWLLKTMAMASAFVGGYMIVDAIRDGPGWSHEPALYAAPFLAFLLWTWDKGFHVCELVDRLLHQQGNGAKQ